MSDNECDEQDSPGGGANNSHGTGCDPKPRRLLAEDWDCRGCMTGDACVPTCSITRTQERC